MTFTSDEWQRLEAYRDRVVDAVCKRYGCTPGDVLSSVRVAKGLTGQGTAGMNIASYVVAARTDAVAILAGTVTFITTHSEVCKIGVTAHPSKEYVTRVPLSGRNIGRLLNISPQGVSLAMRRFTVACFASESDNWKCSLDTYLQQSTSTPKIQPAGEAGCEKGVSCGENKGTL